MKTPNFPAPVEPNPRDYPTYAAYRRAVNLFTIRAFVAEIGNDPSEVTAEAGAVMPCQSLFDEAERVEIEDGYEAAAPLYDRWHEKCGRVADWMDAHPEELHSATARQAEKDAA